MKSYYSILGPWRGFIIPIAVVLGILLSFLIVVMPAYGAIQKTNQDVTDGQKRLDFLNQKVLDLQKLDPEVVDRRLSLMEKAIPSEKDALAGLVLLQTVAASSGISLDSLNVSPGLVSTGSASAPDSQPVQGKNDVVFKGSLTGSIDQLLGFFDTLSRPTFPLFLPTKIDSSNSGGTQQSGNLLLSMLWLPQPKTFGGEDKPVATLNPDEEAFVRWIEQHADSAPSGMMQLDQLNSSSASGKSSLF